MVKRTVVFFAAFFAFVVVSSVNIAQAQRSGVSERIADIVEGDLPRLRDSVDAELQRGLNATIRSSALKRAVREKRFSAALVDITDPKRPRLATINGDSMVYAASLPKIAILLAAFEQMEAGKIESSPQNIRTLTRMIRNSSNTAATEMYYAAGPARISEILQLDRYGLYDRDYNGGLWVGRPYAKRATYKRDPLHNISHGATAVQVARFYYLLENGKLVSPAASLKMKEILGSPAIRHKFVKGLANNRPGSNVFRKSGSWRTYHTDSAIVERNGRRYIAVMLANDVNGGRWLSKLIVEFDDLIHATAVTKAVQNATRPSEYSGIRSAAFGGKRIRVANSGVTPPKLKLHLVAPTPRGLPDQYINAAATD